MQSKEGELKFDDFPPNLFKASKTIQMRAEQGERALSQEAYLAVRDQDNAELNAIMRSISIVLHLQGGFAFSPLPPRIPTRRRFYLFHDR